MDRDQWDIRPDTDQLKCMSGREKTSSLWGDSSFAVALNTIQEVMNVSAAESWLGKISKLSMEIVDVAQVNKFIISMGSGRYKFTFFKSASTTTTTTTPTDSDQADQPNLFAPVIGFRALLQTPGPNGEPFRKLVYETCMLASSLSTRCKALKTRNNPANLSTTLTAHLEALQMCAIILFLKLRFSNIDEPYVRTLQEIKVFIQRRADQAIWRLYMSAESDLDSIQGFRSRLREALDVLARTQSSIASLDIKQADPKMRSDDGLRTDAGAALDTGPHSTPIRTRGPGPPTPTSPFCDSPRLQLAGTTDTDGSNPLKIETFDDLRRKLSTISGVNALLALEKGPVVAQTVDLLQREILSARLDPNLSGYLKQCATCLEALVNKNHTLPASLFVNDITKEGTQPCNGGGFSANVLVNEQGRCLLADFGLAITVAESTTRVKPSTSEMKGSIRWMAPELFRLGNAIHATTEGSKERVNKFGQDIYAFACTILEMITGQPPFADVMTVDAMVILEVGTKGTRPSRPPLASCWCPDNIWALVQQCWAQQSQDRPKASEVHEYLSKLVSLRRSGARWEDIFL
ncbi:hypothetical protein PQX77_018411 [Marasmius sp. AFHP31]|nr:hypothetical protein PQX77_018411 [Marasmius sp. AFHP31]